LNYPERFSKNYEISDFMIILLVGTGLFHAIGQTDRQTDRQTGRQT
jgi:hypothetical protein